MKFRNPLVRRVARSAARIRPRHALFAAIALVGMSAAAVAARAYYDTQRAEWIPGNHGNSESVRRRILAWGIGQIQDGNALGEVLLPLAAADSRLADSAAAALSLLPSARGVWIVAINGRIEVGRRNSQVLDDEELRRVAAVARSQAPAFVGPAAKDGGIDITVITPLPGGRALVRRLNADSTLFSLVDWSQQTTETAQVIVLGLTGPAADSIAALTPLRLPAAPAAGYRLSASQAPDYWRRSLAGGDTTGYFTDHRGVRVLASALTLAPLPWSLVVQIDEDEVMIAPRWMLELALTAALIAVALILVGVAAVRRSRRVKLLKHAVQEEARFRVMVASAMDAVIVTDRSGVIADVNPATLRLFDARADGIIGTCLTDWFARDREVEPTSLAELVAASGGDPAGPKSPYAFRLREPNGERFVEVTGAASRRLDGKEVLTFFVRDVTQRRRIEETLRKSNEIALLGRIAGGLAHDLNNGLLVVLGNAELVRDSLDPAHPEYDSIDAVIASGKRLARLTSEMLSFGRKQMLRPELTDLVRLLRDIEPLVRTELAGDGEGAIRTLRINSRISSAHVRVDRNRLIEALLHLVRNARQAMPAWGQLTIEIAPRSSDGGTCADASPTWQILVRDTGVGMPESVLARAREPFFSTRSRAEAQGLGLSIVEGIVEQSGGFLRIESEPATGTTVALSLPAHRSADLAPESRPGDSGNAQLPSRLFALIVDDDASVRKVVARSVAALGYETIEACHAEHALGLIADARGMDLVITDLVMPGMDGAELRRAILRRYPKLPVLLMSGYTDDELLNRGLHEPGAVFLPKPFARAELLRVLDQLRRGQDDASACA